MSRPKRKRKYTKRADYWRAKMKTAPVKRGTVVNKDSLEYAIPAASPWLSAEDSKAVGPGLYVRKTPVHDRINFDVVRFILIDDGHSPCFRIMQDGQDTSPAVNSASLFQKVEE